MSSSLHLEGGGQEGKRETVPTAKPLLKAKPIVDVGTPAARLRTVVTPPAPPTNAPVGEPPKIEAVVPPPVKEEDDLAIIKDRKVQVGVGTVAVGLATVVAWANGLFSAAAKQEQSPSSEPTSPAVAKVEAGTSHTKTITRPASEEVTAPSAVTAPPSETPENFNPTENQIVFEPQNSEIGTEADDPAPETNPMATAEAAKTAEDAFMERVMAEKKNMIGFDEDITRLLTSKNINIFRQELEKMRTAVKNARSLEKALALALYIEEKMKEYTDTESNQTRRVWVFEGRNKGINTMADIGAIASARSTLGTFRSDVEAAGPNPQEPKKPSIGKGNVASLTKLADGTEKYIDGAEKLQKAKAEADRLVKEDPAWALPKDLNALFAQYRAWQELLKMNPDVAEALRQRLGHRVRLHAGGVKDAIDKGNVEGMIAGLGYTPETLPASATGGGPKPTGPSAEIANGNPVERVVPADLPNPKYIEEWDAWAWFAPEPMSYAEAERYAFVNGGYLPMPLNEAQYKLIISLAKGHEIFLGGRKGADGKMYAANGAPMFVVMRLGEGFNRTEDVVHLKAEDGMTSDYSSKDAVNKRVVLCIRPAKQAQPPKRGKADDPKKKVGYNMPSVSPTLSNINRRNSSEAIMRQQASSRMQHAKTMRRA